MVIKYFESYMQKEIEGFFETVIKAKGWEFGDKRCQGEGFCESASTDSVMHTVL